MFDTGLEPTTLVLGGRRLEDWATEASKYTFKYKKKKKYNERKRTKFLE